MKLIRPIALLLAFSLTAFPLCGEEINAALTDEERTALVELLEASRSETESLASQATAEAWSMKPAEDRWSVGEVVEHLARAEEAIFGLGHSALATDPDPEWQALAQGGTEALLQSVRDRSQRFQAPEMLQPTNEKDRAATLEWYAAKRSKTLDFVRSTTAEIKAHVAEGPPGRMNVHSWMTLIAGHNQRHNDQIREILEWIESGAEPMAPASAEAAAPDAEQPASESR